MQQGTYILLHIVSLLLSWFSQRSGTLMTRKKTPKKNKM